MVAISILGNSTLPVTDAGKSESEPKLTILVDKAATVMANVSEVKVKNKSAETGDDDKGDGSGKPSITDKKQSALNKCTLTQEHSYSSKPSISKTVTVIAPPNVKDSPATENRSGNIYPYGRLKADFTIRERPPKPPKKPIFYNCTVCNKKVAERQRRRHELSHLGEKPHECSFCQKKFALKSVMIIHERIHKGEKPFKCGTCDRSFTQKTHLTSHEVTHISKSVFCSACGKGFASRKRLAGHERVHSTVNKLTCNTCGRKFVRKIALKNHQAIHNQKLRKCSLCDKIFKYPYQLKEHQLFHNSETPYKCEICDKGFRIKKSLSKHKKTHDVVEDPHQCPICERWFQNKALLTQHARSHAQFDLEDDIAY